MNMLVTVESCRGEAASGSASSQQHLPRTRRWEVVGDGSGPQGGQFSSPAASPSGNILNSEEAK